MNVLYIGRFYPKGIIETIVEDTGGKIGFSNHNFEMSLIKGFSQQPDVNLRVLTAPMVFSYPHNNRNASIKPLHYVENGINIRSIGFCNIAVLNMFSTIRNLAKAVREELVQFEGEEVSVIVNTPSLVLNTALFNAIKKSKKKVTTTLIVPDVPECMNRMSGKRTLKGLIGDVLNKRNAELSKRYDYYVLLTEAMNDFYKADKNQYIVMEGLMDESKLSDKYSKPQYGKGKEIILYTGTLARIFGILDLVEAFEKAQLPNAELWICGSGECSTILEEKAKANPSIKFYGLVSSTEALELQSKATILANPRSADDEYTKYSFPSKTIEYLLAGRSVIMNRLPGVPSEYDEFIYYPENESTDAWARCLTEIITMEIDKRYECSEKGRQFILSKKIAVKQCARVLKFIE